MGSPPKGQPAPKPPEKGAGGHFAPPMKHEVRLKERVGISEQGVVSSGGITRPLGATAKTVEAGKQLGIHKIDISTLGNTQAERQSKFNELSPEAQTVIQAQYIRDQERESRRNYEESNEPEILQSSSDQISVSSTDGFSWFDEQGNQVQFGGGLVRGPTQYFVELGETVGVSDKNLRGTKKPSGSYPTVKVGSAIVPEVLVSKDTLSTLKAKEESSQALSEK